jgi:hypothetical protein
MMGSTNMLAQRLRISILLVGFVALCPLTALWAQSPGRLDGTIVDTTQAAIPDAEIELTNTATGVVSKSTSNSNGQYVFAFVLPGSYTLSATHPGFKPWAKEIVVHANDHIAVNVTLTVGAASETVSVSSSASAVPVTDSGQRSETLTNQQIQAFSTESPDAEELLELLPGITVNGAGVSGYGNKFDPHVVSSANNGIEGFNVNGNRSDANTFKLDGGNMDDLTGNNGSNIYPNTEFISELTVETSNFTADQGGSPILVTAVTKSGTKDFHGELFWSGRNYAFDANDWSNNFNGTKRPGSKFNYPGFSLGGPVLIPGVDYNRGDKKKLFFFFGANWSRQLPDLGTQLGDVPTAAELTGNFSDIVLSPTCTAARTAGNADSAFYLNQPCQITDPATGLTLDQQNGQLTGVTANGMGLLKSLEGPNLVGPNYTDPNGLWNFSGHPLYPQNVTQYVGRFDWDPSDKARIFVRLGRQDETQFSPWSEYAGIGSTWTSSVPDPTPTVQEYHSRSVNISMVNLLSPTMTNEFVFNSNVLRQPNHYQNANILSKQSLGVKFAGIFPGNTYPLVPQILDNFAQCSSSLTIGCGSTGAGEGPGQGRWGASNLVGAGNYYKQTQFEFGDSLTKVIGAHTLKFGGLIGRARNDQNLSGDALEGAMVMSNWAGDSSGDEYADLLIEHSTEFEQASNDVRGNLRSSVFEWYGQDNWKVNKRLTLEYGVRWTFQGPWYEARGLGSTFDPTAYTKANSSSVFDGVRTASCKNPGQSAVPLCGTIPKTITPYGHPVTEPRIGFSWDALGNGKAVLRGGFGQYTQRDPTNSGFGAIVGPPNVLYAAVSNNFAGFTSLSQIEQSNPGAQPAFTYGESNAVYSPRDTHQAAIYQYNLTVSSSLPHHMFTEVAYVGSQSRHLSIEQNINNIPLGALWTPGTHLVPTGVQGLESSVTPYAPFAQIVQIQHEGNANYNGLQTTLRRQGSHSLDFIASYTYSKAVGDSDNFQTVLADPFAVSGSRHVLSFDRTHSFSIGYQYHIPSGARGSLAKSAIARGALSGWDLTGITRATSGGPIAIVANIHCYQPMTPGGTPEPCPSSAFPLWSASDTWFGTNAWANGFLPGANTGTPNGVYPAYTCDPKAHHGGVNTSFINPNCVTLPAFGQQGFINPPYMKTPGVFTSDLAIQKVFKLGESRRLNIRVSSFNFLNRAQLAVPSNIANFNWTLPYGATDPDQGVPSLSNANGQCVGAVGPLGYSCQKIGHREMEASVKFFF